jgi:monovalent cation/hydrogen antiporter
MQGSPKDREKWPKEAIDPLHLFERYLDPRTRQPSWRNVLIVTWTGMRGGVSLAADLALPLTLVGGKPFPQRDLVIFLTFCAILASLLGQGLSLAPLNRLLHLQEDGSREREHAHAHAHLTAVHAALARLDELAMEQWIPKEYLTHLRSLYEKNRGLHEASERIWNYRRPGR